MIDNNDRINNEYYVDQAIKHMLELGYKGVVFPVNRFLNYGTPEDYELYTELINHFSGFCASKDYLGVE